MRNAIRTALGVTVLVLGVLGSMGAGSRHSLTSGQAVLPAPAPGETGDGQLLQRRPLNEMIERPASRHVADHQHSGARPTR